jgi:hypothetical protein
VITQTVFEGVYRVQQDATGKVWFLCQVWARTHDRYGVLHEQYLESRDEVDVWLAFIGYPRVQPFTLVGSSFLARVKNS